MLGGESFQKRMLELAAKTVGAGRRENYERRGPLARHDEREAEKMLSRGLERLQLEARNLEDLKKSDERKQALAWWVRSKTTVSRRWLAERLSMGHEVNVAGAVARFSSPRDIATKRTKKTLIRCSD